MDNGIATERESAKWNSEKEDSRNLEESWPASKSKLGSEGLWDRKRWLKLASRERTSSSYMWIRSLSYKPIWEDSNKDFPWRRSPIGSTLWRIKTIK